MEKGEYESAANSIKKCLDLNPKHVPGLVAMGNLLFTTGHSAPSVKYHEKALAFNPQDIQALIGMANSLYDLNET
jgi:tetratricopeptide (TPR) repeat protein